jgi:histidinol-phosphate aminotransferase
MEAMAKENVFVGRVWPIYPTWVRVTVGTPQEMARFREAFAKTMDQSLSPAAELDSPSLSRKHPGEFYHRFLT